MAKLIHIAKILLPNQKKRSFLYLREMAPNTFTWFSDGETSEIKTPVSGETPALAINKAYLYWKDASFQTLRCGKRFELTERDETGNTALFYQMVSSQESSNGQYFDVGLNQMCLVNHASTEAIKLMNQLKKEGRLKASSKC